MTLEKVTVEGINYWNRWFNRPNVGRLPQNHFNFAEVISDAVKTRKHPCDSSEHLDSKKYWYTGWEYSEWMMLCVQVKEEGDIDKNTKWFYDGKQVYPVED